MAMPLLLFEFTVLKSLNTGKLLFFVIPVLQLFFLTVWTEIH
ncbi:unnamed protein product, partial [marine sediment metagenome]